MNIMKNIIIILVIILKNLKYGVINDLLIFLILQDDLFLNYFVIKIFLLQYNFIEMIILVREYWIILFFFNLFIYIND